MMKGVDTLSIRDSNSGAVVAVKAVAGSSRDRVVGVLGNCLKVAVSAPAEKGKANAAVARTLAGALGVGSRGLKLLSGATSPRKEFLVAGMTASQLRAKLTDLP